MKNIDEIIGMLDSNNQKEVQEEGIMIAMKVKTLKVFFFPSYPNNPPYYSCKCLWENSAKVIANKSDEELEPYLPDMFEWLVDVNWPGAWTIFERLKNYKRDSFNPVFNEYLKRSIAFNDENLKSILIDLRTSREK